MYANNNENVDTNYQSICFAVVGEELPFPPREITIHKDYWYERDYELQDEILGRYEWFCVRKPQ